MGCYAIDVMRCYAMLWGVIDEVRAQDWGKGIVSVDDKTILLFHKD
jgi:hypothetical protein